MITISAGITLSRDTVLSLAAAHIAQFAERIELKRPGTRIDDCEYYLTLWKEIRTAVSRGTDLGTEQLGEIYDSITSGDHDCLLSTVEFCAVHLSPARAS